jgi:hypothetical protein
MEGLYVPHKSFVLVDAPKLVEEEEENVPSEDAAPAPKNETRKTWIKNLLEKKARLKREAEGISESEHSDVDSPAAGRTKFRRAGRESKFDSSASEMSDSEYSSASGAGSSGKPRKSTKGRRRVKTTRGKKNTKSGKTKSPAASGGVLDDDLLAGFDPNEDFLPGFLDDSQQSGGGQKKKKKKQTKAQKKKDLQKLEKFWEMETQKAEDDLSKFVLDFSTSLKAKEGGDGLVLDSFFDEDDDIGNTTNSQQNPPGLQSSLSLEHSFTDRQLMTSLDTGGLMDESGALDHSLMMPEDLASGMVSMSLDKSDFTLRAGQVAANLSLSTSGSVDGVNVGDSLAGIIETSQESMTFEEGVEN